MRNARFFTLFFLAACGPQPTEVASSTPECAEAPLTPVLPNADPVDVVQRYLAANTTGDLDAAAKLVTDDSVVFESGGNEGTWAHYREHHLGPEVAMFADFTLRQQDPSVKLSADRTLASVTVPIEYDIKLRDAREIHSVGTVTFVVRFVNTQYLIEHIHWSSRRRRPAAVPEIAAELAAYKAASDVFVSNCGGCHTSDGAKSSKAALSHFDMSSYPFKGHHTADMDKEILRALGQAKRKPTMPKPKPGSVTGDDLALVLAWAKSFAVAKAAGLHETSSGSSGHSHD